jgi:hypothetical protein
MAAARTFAKVNRRDAPLTTSWHHASTGSRRHVRVERTSPSGPSRSGACEVLHPPAALAALRPAFIVAEPVGSVRSTTARYRAHRFRTHSALLACEFDPSSAPHVHRHIRRIRALGRCPIEGRPPDAMSIGRSREGPDRRRASPRVAASRSRSRRVHLLQGCTRA